MKKVNVVAALSTLMFSCGSGPSSPCDCANALTEMNASFEEAQGDEAKLEKLNTTFQQLDKECNTLREEMGKEKFQAEMKDCLEEMN